MQDIIEMGVWAIIGIAILSVLATLALHFLAQRSQQHTNETSQANLYNLHALGIQAIIGANEMMIVDNSLQDRDGQPTQAGSTAQATVQGGAKT
jgi:LPS O-antigen subunit length determinant protein (WzzB/FepE family)